MARTTLSAAMVATLKTFVANSVDAQIVDARTRGDTFKLMGLLNADVSPVVKAWGIAMDAPTLDDAATYTTYDSMTQGKRDEWQIFLQFAPRDMSKAKNRAVVTDVWGNATAGSVAESVLNAGTENASVAENAIGGTSRTTGTVTALDRSFAGDVTQTDCQAILAA